MYLSKIKNFRNFKGVLFNVKLSTALREIRPKIINTLKDSLINIICLNI